MLLGLLRPSGAEEKTSVEGSSFSKKEYLQNVGRY
jgi:hypothetical protein